MENGSCQNRKGKDRRNKRNGGKTVKINCKSAKDTPLSHVFIKEVFSMKRFIVILSVLLMFIFLLGCNDETTDTSLISDNTITTESSTVDIPTSEQSTANSEKTDLPNNSQIFTISLSSFNENICSKEARCRCIPLVKILIGLGADVKWENDYQANIEFEGKTYFLDTKDYVLTGTDIKENILYPVEPDIHTHYAGEKEDFCIGMQLAYSVFIDLRIDYTAHLFSDMVDFYVIKGDSSEQSTVDSNKTDLPDNPDTFVISLYHFDAKECSLEPRCYSVPIVEILIGLGADVKWENDFQANIEFEGETYFLDTKEHLLMQTDSDINFLESVVEGMHTHCQGEKEDFCIGMQLATIVFSYLNIDYNSQAGQLELFVIK